LQLTPEWFPPSEASFKRSLIRMLIYNLLHETSQKDGIVATVSTNGHSQNSDIELEKEAAIELLSHPCGPTETVVSPVCPVDSSACPMIVTQTEDGGHDMVEGENVQKNISEGISQCEENTSAQIAVPESCILVVK
jgi:hypothetical protein